MLYFWAGVYPAEQTIICVLILFFRDYNQSKSTPSSFFSILFSEAQVRRTYTLSSDNTPILLPSLTLFPSISLTFAFTNDPRWFVKLRHNHLKSLVRAFALYT